MAVAQILQVFNQKELTGCRYLRVSLRRAIRMNASIPSCRFGVLFYLATIAGVSGQVAASPPSSSQQASPTPVVGQALSSSSAYQAMLQNFLSSRQGLARQMETLIQQGATEQQMETWWQQNAVAIQNERQLAVNLAAATPPQPLPIQSEVSIPEDATPEMSSYLVTRADLANKFAALYNQQIQSASSDTDVVATFAQQNAAEIQTLQQQAQIVSAQSAQQTMPVPPPLVIPPGSTPQLAAFLTTRDQLMRSRIQLQNQYATADPATRQAALQQWQQQNATLIQQMQQQAQNLSQANSTTPN
jgi:hypothetical protein